MQTLCLRRLPPSRRPCNLGVSQFLASALREQMWGSMNLWRWSLVVVALQAVVLGAEAQGAWRVITKNAGVTAMHAAVTPNVGSVVILDHTNTGPSNLTFPDHWCRKTTYDMVLKTDCFAHSAIVDPWHNGTVRPLRVMTDTQCSGAQFTADGTLQQAGGDREGTYKTRSLSPKCYAVQPVNRHCDWVESNLTLRYPRWYATNILLPDNRQIIFGGRDKHQTCEFIPPTVPPTPALYMPFLNMTQDGITCNLSSNMCNYTTNGPNNWYPFAYLLPTPNQIFLFANRDSIIYDYVRNIVVRNFPRIPGNPRNYPSGGSSVMLPMRWEDGYQKVEVMVCGGATKTTNVYADCSTSCGRMVVTDPNATWAMEDMPIQRCMGDMVLLPDTNILIINGAQNGFQGWCMATSPARNPVLYQPANALGNRFSVLNPAATPRMYHSSAVLLPDGSVMVGGSNSHEYYTFNRGNINPDVFFPTELSLEAFLPPYAQADAGGRPTIVSVSPTKIKLNATVQIHFYDNKTENQTQDTFLFTMNPPPWSTHSFSHGQRMVTLMVVNNITIANVTNLNGVPVNARTATLAIPKLSTVLPPAYYMLWVVKNGNPSQSCVWVRITG